MLGVLFHCRATEMLCFIKHLGIGINRKFTGDHQCSNIHHVLKFDHLHNSVKVKGFKLYRTV